MWISAHENKEAKIVLDRYVPFQKVDSNWAEVDSIEAKGLKDEFSIEDRSQWELFMQISKPAIFSISRRIEARNLRAIQPTPIS